MKQIHYKRMLLEFAFSLSLWRGWAELRLWRCTDLCFVNRVKGEHLVNSNATAGPSTWQRPAKGRVTPSASIRSHEPVQAAGQSAPSRSSPSWLPTLVFRGDQDHGTAPSQG